MLPWQSSYIWRRRQIDNSASPKCHEDQNTTQFSTVWEKVLKRWNGFNENMYAISTDVAQEKLVK